MTRKDCLDEKKAGFNNSNGPTDHSNPIPQKMAGVGVYMCTGYVTLHTCCKTAVKLAKHDILSHS